MRLKKEVSHLTLVRENNHNQFGKAERRWLLAKSYGETLFEDVRKGNINSNEKQNAE